ncbi:hypothetical protein ACJBSD_10200, partial [Streptococcus suis]
EQPLQSSDTPQAPIIFNHFKATANTPPPPTDTEQKIHLTAPSQQVENVLQANNRSQDLWQHIANNLTIEVYLHKALNKRIAWYTKQPNYL